MKTRYKFINFRECLITKDSPHPAWLCYNNKTATQLGKLEWYAPWRQYCFTVANEAIVFSKSCLEDICHFINQL